MKNGTEEAEIIETSRKLQRISGNTVKNGSHQQHSFSRMRARNSLISLCVHTYLLMLISMFPCSLWKHGWMKTSLITWAECLRCQGDVFMHELLHVNFFLFFYGKHYGMFPARLASARLVHYTVPRVTILAPILGAPSGLTRHHSGDVAQSRTLIG